jgi:hypothetical protein
MSVNRASNSFRSGGATTTVVGAGRSVLVVANAITASTDQGASLANNTRKASSMATSLLWAAWCRIFR